MKKCVRQHGFSLIELLVAVLILSFGMLGMAGLQTMSLRNNNNAYMRTQANVLAYSMVDSMRANRDAVISNKYNIALSASAPSGSEIENVDLSNWLGQLAQVLPDGDGAIACDSNDVCTITVQWTEISSENATTQFLLSTGI